jgi:hypothetical protein
MDRITHLIWERILAYGNSNQQIVAELGVDYQTVSAIRLEITGRENGAFGKSSIRWLSARYSREQIQGMTGLPLCCIPIVKGSVRKFCAPSYLKKYVQLRA